MKLLKPLLFLLIKTSCFSQVYVNAPRVIEKARAGITYVVLNDPNSEAAKPFREVLEKNWNFSSLKFLKKGEEVFILPSEKTSILELGFEKCGDDSLVDANFPKRSNDLTYFYLTLYSLNDKYESKGSGLFNDVSGNGCKTRKNILAQVKMYGDRFAQENPTLVLNEFSDDTNGHIKNWTPALLKIYVKTIQNLFDKEQEYKSYLNKVNNEELLKLKSQSLIVPDFLLHLDREEYLQKGYFNGDTPKEIFEKYGYPYKIVSKTDFEKLVLESDEPKYVFTFVKNCALKYISVVNVATGEIVYNEGLLKTYMFQLEDIRSLSRLIQKAK